MGIDQGGQARAKILARAAERLRSRREEPAQHVTREMGKTVFENRAEVDGAITPWNLPPRAWSWGVRFPRIRLSLVGAFSLPAVVGRVEETNAIAREEIFGPILPVLTFSDLDEAIQRAISSRYGLSSCVFTRELSLAEKAIREFRFGETYVNRVGPESPQGYHAGSRQSGPGGAGTVWGVWDYLPLKSVYVDWKEPHSADHLPPYPG